MIQVFLLIKVILSMINHKNTFTMLAGLTDRIIEWEFKGLYRNENLNVCQMKTLNPLLQQIIVFLQYFYGGIFQK